MLVIPAIDLLNGKVVRLTKGNYRQATVYNDHPIEEAENFKRAGFSHIHIIDLNGAKEGRFVNLKHIRKIVEETGLSVQTGGGIRSFENGEQLLQKGIQSVICSSMAVKNQNDWFKLLEKYPERVILGMDLKDGKVAYGGWKETSDQPIQSFLEPMMEKGLKHVLCTDISRDGTLSGPNVALYQSLIEDFPALKIIASGGVGKKGDLVALEKTGVYGVVVGKAYYEQKITLKQLACFAG